MPDVGSNFNNAPAVMYCKFEILDVPTASTLESSASVVKYPVTWFNICVDLNQVFVPATCGLEKLS